ncbi:neuromedin-B isoform X2 [Canis lupus baileyi]|uniref:neuromedin-B isoform X2 n=1 Tax=Canis lupus familiaris TaxID=9615 RepID=UPI0003ADBEA2|nr:neuromedin-B isoform X2 [Canis lupus familiaris]XP_025293819.1 neuromedin-B isoform X2 [Canis lupus dingo]XP_038516475.1 neuromedin-B isoform X2 [Canis lupus familiaris]|eukprot:XP_005618431.1 neuromedin-B isoform X2 [Canis lupus familiaris]
MTLRAGGARLLSGLLLFALLAAAAGAAPLSWGTPEHRSGAIKIRVHPRGNLWATGHFMGKKSLETPSPFLLGTASHVSLRDQRLQLSHDLPRILRLKKVLGMSLSGPAPQPQEDADANAAEGRLVMRKRCPRDLDCAHPGKVLNGTLAVAPSGSKT